MNIALLPVSSLDHNTSRGGHLQVLCLGHVHHCSYDMGPAFSTTQYFLVFNLLVLKSCWYKYPFSVRVLFVDSLLSSFPFFLVFGSCIFGSRHDIFICKQLLLWLASCHIWREEWQTNKEKGKTCLFTGKADVQHMPFTCVTDDSDSPDNSLHDNKILTITNLES